MIRKDRTGGACAVPAGALHTAAPLSYLFVFAAKVSLPDWKSLSVSPLAPLVLSHFAEFRLWNPVQAASVDEVPSSTDTRRRLPRLPPPVPGVLEGAVPMYILTSAVSDPV